MMDEYNFPLPVTYATLDEIRAECLRDHALQRRDGIDPMYEMGLDDAFHELRERMNASGTVFYQP